MKWLIRKSGENRDIVDPPMLVEIRNGVIVKVKKDKRKLKHIWMNSVKLI
jgi:hypothetical protein